MRPDNVTVGALIVFLSAATTATAQQGDRRSIDAVQQAFQTAVQTWDVDAWSRLFTEDAVMLTPFAQRIVGRDAFRQYWTKAWEGRQSSDRNPLSLTRRNTLEDGNLAVVQLDYGPEGGETVGQYVWTLIRESDGAWRIALWMFTRPPPRQRGDG